MKLFLTVMSLTVIYFASKVSSRFIPGTMCDVPTLEPCEIHPALPTSILCENLDDIRTFIRVMRCGARQNLQEIFLEDSSIESIPFDVMDFCGFDYLNLKNVSLTNFYEDPTGAMLRLQQLHMDGVTLNATWSWQPLAYLDNLLRFSAANMEVGSLDSDLVGHLNGDLQSFALTATNTTALADDAFARFSELVYVSVQDNELEELKRSMFPSPSKIMYFYFGKNRISFLPEDLFSDMPDLHSVGIQDNMISEMWEVTFRGVWHRLSIVLMEGNPFKCQCKMLWLAKKGAPSVLTGTCISPKAKYGKELKHLSTSDFEC